jgi:membrane-associated HD superfamily phosphohydrolase
MWYEETMNLYAESGLKERGLDYDDPTNTKRMDAQYAKASIAVFKESQQTFQQIMPIIAQMQKQLDALKQQQQPMDPDAQALIQTSMAETNRRAQRDKAEMAISQQRLQQDGQIESSRIQADLSKSNADNQLKVALDSTNNITKQNIESAKISHDADSLRHEQAKTALELQNRAQSYLGGQNV